MGPRLEPIEEPEGPNMRFVYWMMRRKVGKVMTPGEVVTARMPGSLGRNRKLRRSPERIRLELGLELIAEPLTSEINGCGCCVDLAQSVTQQERNERTPVQNVQE